MPRQGSQRSRVGGNLQRGSHRVRSPQNRNLLKYLFHTCNSNYWCILPDQLHTGVLPTEAHSVRSHTYSIMDHAVPCVRVNPKEDKPDSHGSTNGSELLWLGSTAVKTQVMQGGRGRGGEESRLRTILQGGAHACTYVMIKVPEKVWYT